jgi:dipeptide transport system ATP-binding protein
VTFALLEVEDLCVDFGPLHAPLPAVTHLDLTVARGEIVGLVGESGSGKSVAALAVMGLVDPPARVRAQRLAFAGHDLRTLPPSARRRLLGSQVAMIFQDPLASLDPCYSVGFQLGESLRLHGNAAERRKRSARHARMVELLREVELPDPARCLQAFPHQLSGGMAQRVMIAMALAAQPRLLIADEPTTALDVTVQAQVLDLLVRLARGHGMAVLLISHDLAVVAETADRVLVMYAGRAMEEAAVPAIFATPRNPYTRALLDALPSSRAGSRLAALPGMVPPPGERGAACVLAPRCPLVRARCSAVAPPFARVDGARSRCHFPLDDGGRPQNDWLAAPAAAAGP